MATLQDSTVDSLTLSGDFTVQGDFTLSTKDYLDVQVSNLGVYSTVGPVPFESIEAGSGGSITPNVSLSRFTVSNPGYYHTMYYNISNADTNVGESRAEIRKNNLNGAQARGDGNLAYPMVTAFKIFYMDVGDYFELYLMDGAHYFTGAVNDYTHFLMHKLYF